MTFALIALCTKSDDLVYFQVINSFEIFFILHNHLSILLFAIVVNVFQLFKYQNDISLNTHKCDNRPFQMSKCMYRCMCVKYTYDLTLTFFVLLKQKENTNEFGENQNKERTKKFHWSGCRYKERNFLPINPKSISKMDNSSLNVVCKLIFTYKKI